MLALLLLRTISSGEVWSLLGNEEVANACYFSQCPPCARRALAGFDRMLGIARCMNCFATAAERASFRNFLLMSKTTGAPLVIERCFLFEGGLLSLQEALSKTRRKPTLAQWVKEAQPGQTHLGFRCLGGSVEQRRSDAEFVRQIVCALLVHDQDVGLHGGRQVLRHFKRYDLFEGREGTQEVTAPGIYLLESISNDGDPQPSRRRAALRPTPPQAPFWRFLCTIDDADEAMAPLIANVPSFERMNVLTTLRAERAIEAPAARERVRHAGVHRACSRAGASTTATSRTAIRTHRQPGAITR